MNNSNNPYEPPKSPGSKSNERFASIGIDIALFFVAALLCASVLIARPILYNIYADFGITLPWLTRFSLSNSFLGLLTFYLLAVGGNLFWRSKRKPYFLVVLLFIVATGVLAGFYILANVLPLISITQSLS